MNYQRPPTYSLQYGSFHPGGPPPIPRGVDDSPVGRVLAWIVILVSVAALVWSNARESKLAPAAAPTTATRPGTQLQFIGKYVVGAHAVTAKTNPNATSATTMVAQLDGSAESPVDKLAVVAVVGELEGKSAALARLDGLAKTLPDRLKPQAEAMRTIYTTGPDALSNEQRAELKHSLGWFGDLALVFGRPENHPQRAKVLEAAGRSFWVIIGFLGIGFLAGAVGLALCIYFIVKIGGGTLVRNYRASPGGGGVFLEAFAIYIGGITAANYAAGMLPHVLQKSISAHIALMIGPTILAIAWPLIRGANSTAWRFGIGWNTGQGALREMAIGLVGYLAGLPVLFVGFLITAVLIKLSGAHPTHPIDHMLGVSPAMTFIVFMLASVYAPITEETMFRGAFFHALRARHRWLLSAVVSSFIFAAVHPQGWTVIPVLMSIAIVFAGIREWRGTIFSSAAAHCLHNTVVLLLATLVLQ
ncbi:MAG TPA: type II CAAX endopeptidase family protein [Tepidisphaeraceae bacterium]|jgi:membrane protease YdiL (CAAX protease family)|nr:type II CAAX endopeptidase family protein [Tepidisphaeraceae bacterium]